MCLKDLNPRIIVPIPGKQAIGIEIENEERQIVYFKDLVKSREFKESQFSLPVIIGSTVSNKPYIVDLAKLTHLLVGGAYGQGVSVFLNNVVTSLLKCRTPEDVNFILIDPSKIQFSEFNNLENSYLIKVPANKEAVLTDVTQILNTLNSLNLELENRIKLLKKYAVKNISEYNSLINPDFSLGKSIKKMSYLVVIIDS